MKQFVNVTILSTDIKDFLESSTKELDDTFSSTCTFPRMSKVLMQHVYEMKVKVEQMRMYARLLLPRKATTLLKKSTVKATSIYVKYLYQITMHAVPIVLD